MKLLHFLILRFSSLGTNREQFISFIIQNPNKDVSGATTFQWVMNVWKLHL